jgi:hypothetical protein
MGSEVEAVSGTAREVELRVTARGGLKIEAMRAESAAASPVLGAWDWDGNRACLSPWRIVGGRAWTAASRVSGE